MHYVEGKTLAPENSVHFLIHPAQGAACGVPHKPPIHRAGPGYEVDDLVDFLNGDDDLELQFFGGEPRVETGLMRRILGETRVQHSTLHTDGLSLHLLDSELRARLDTISVCLEGPRHLTDHARGPGIYDRVLAELTALAELGYSGRIELRLALPAGTSVYEAVSHFFGACEFTFDSITWRILPADNAIEEGTRRKHFSKWLRRVHHPEVNRLIEEWTTEIIDHHRVIPVLQFMAPVFALLSGETVTGGYVGTERLAWRIDEGGSIYPSPRLTGPQTRAVGEIGHTPSEDLEYQIHLSNRCANCDVLYLCGGEYCSASEPAPSTGDVFDFNCPMMRHIIEGLRRKTPAIGRAISRGYLSLDDFSIAQLRSNRKFADKHGMNSTANTPR